MAKTAPLLFECVGEGVSEFSTIKGGPERFSNSIVEKTYSGATRIEMAAFDLRTCRGDGSFSRHPQSMENAAWMRHVVSQAPPLVPTLSTGTHQGLLALTVASLSLDPLADICWAILQCYPVRFTAIEKGDCILAYKR